MSPVDASPESPSSVDARRRVLTGGFYAFGAYFLWGFMPFYFLSLAPTGPIEIVAWRVVLSLVFCALLLTILRKWGGFARIIRQRRLRVWTAVAGVLVFINWTAYLIGALTGHVIEASLGYFINPIVTVLLAVLVLRERLRPAQWAAIAIAALAVVVIIVGYGSFPWIALTIAFSFGFYGLVKKQIGPSVDAISGLTLESLWVMPLAIAGFVIAGATTGLTFGSYGAVHAILVLCAGIVSATPLMLFAAGARRIPLSLAGLLQFIAPIMQFVIGAWLLGEPMPIERWVGFGLVWLALVVLTADSLMHARSKRSVSDVAELT